MALRTRPWRLLLTSTLFLVLTLGASLWLLVSDQGRRHNESLARDLRLHALLLQGLVERRWPSLTDGPVAEAVANLRADGIDLAILTTAGDALVPPRIGTADEIARLPEVQLARTQGAAHSARRWGPDQRDVVTVAVRLDAEPAGGVLWLSRPAWTLASDQRALARTLWVGGVLIAVITVGLLFALFRMRRRLLRRLVISAQRLSAGDLHTDIDIRGGDELTHLSVALNNLRRRLRAQIETIDRQRQDFVTLLNQLHEGVVVTDADGRITLINPAAVRLLNLRTGPDGPAALLGRPVEACIPQHPVQRLLLPGPAPADDSDAQRRPIVVEGPDRTAYLLADAADLALAGAGSTGRAVLLTDVTEMQRTIQLRTDFVANASHELRTPLSTIRAAVETLLAMDLPCEAAAAQQFLRAINRHSARLERMVKDLLDLARLESPAKQFAPETLNPRRIADDLHHRFAETIAAKGVLWEAHITPPDAASVRLSPQLLALVLDNLVDNAIKFTPAHRHVRFHIDRPPDAVVFTVSDEGCGIPPEDQQRVFERFYQVERARSGSERGTGLGLSIVRHAVGALRGTIDLASTPDRGTRITVRIPQPPPVPPRHPAFTPQ